MINARPPRRIGSTDRPTRSLSCKALIAVLAVMLMVLVSASCASSDDSETSEFAVGPELRDCIRNSAHEMHGGQRRGLGGYVNPARVHRVGFWGMGWLEPGQHGFLSETPGSRIKYG